MMNWMPSLGSLQAFESSAKLGSFTRAATELHVTQSAISRQIRQLEEMLDVRLFERIHQRVVLTDAGKLYLNDITVLLSGLCDATQRIMACGGTTNLLNLAVLPTFATRWLIPRLPMFLDEHPGVTTNLSTRIAPFDFSSEPFDAAIHYGKNNWAGGVAYHLMDEEIVPVCSPAFRDLHRIRKPADVDNVTLLHQVTRPTAWLEWFRKAGVKDCFPLRGPRFEQFAMISQAAVSGLGAALLPRFLVEEELDSGRLVMIFNHGLHSDTSYFLVLPEQKAETPLIASFREWIIKSANRKGKPRNS